MQKLHKKDREYAWVYIVVMAICISTAILVWSIYDTQIDRIDVEVRTKRDRN